MKQLITILEDAMRETSSPRLILNNILALIGGEDDEYPDDVKLLWDFVYHERNVLDELDCDDDIDVAGYLAEAATYTNTLAPLACAFTILHRRMALGDILDKALCSEEMLYLLIDYQKEVKMLLMLFTISAHGDRLYNAPFDSEDWSMDALYGDDWYVVCDRSIERTETTRRSLYFSMVQAILPYLYTAHQLREMDNIEEYAPKWWVECLLQVEGKDNAFEKLATLCHYWNQELSNEESALFLTTDEIAKILISVMEKN